MKRNMWTRYGIKVGLRQCCFESVCGLLFPQNKTSQAKNELGQTLIQWGLGLGSVSWEKSRPDSSRQPAACSSFGNAEWLVIIAATDLYLFLNKYSI